MSDQSSESAGAAQSMEQQVDQLLAEWEAGRVTAVEVHEWAVARYAVSGVEIENDVVNQVLAELDALDVNLVIAQDVPELRTLLRSDPATSAAAIARYESYAASLDLAARRRQLAGDPLYAPFCGPASSP